MVAGLQKLDAKMNVIGIHIQLYLTITRSKKIIYLTDLMPKICA